MLGYIWAKEAYGATLFATAVSDLPIHAVFADPAYRPLLTAVAAEVLAQAPVRPLPLDGFDPADLPGSLDRMAEFNRQSAKTHSGIYRDLAIRHRPTEVRRDPRVRCTVILLRRISELVGAIERGERTCTRENLDLLAAYERLERLGRPVNAVVAVTGAPARAAAGPLAGQPVAVKDIVAVAGLPTRCGSPATSDDPSPADAALVTRLRAAGAEVFATTQCLEFAAGFAHPDVGDTRNPRDPARTSGGSSGGSAAVVAAGVCDARDRNRHRRLDPDPGRLLRRGRLEADLRLVPEEGVFPLSPSCDHAGTLAATAADCAALLTVIAGLPPGAAATAPPAAPAVGVLTAQLADPSVTAEVRSAIRAALRQLTAAGWQLREISQPWPEDLARWEHVLSVIVAAEAWQVHSGRDTSRYAAGTRALLDFGRQVTPAQYSAAQSEQAELAAAVEVSLAGLDVLAGPTVGYCAPEQDPPFGVGEDSGEGRFTGPYNLTGHPAVSIPVPAPGLPVGLQLAGRRGRDLELLAVAGAAERVLAA